MSLEAAMQKALLRLAAILGFLAFVLSAPAQADEAEAQAHALIQRQLDAFAQGDAAGAYALAAPGIKVIFPNSDVFMDMVRQRYAPVYHHRSANFGTFKAEGDDVSQDLTIVDDDNQVWTAIYKLTRQPDGSWLISGCFLVKSEAKSV
jgi:hypothetical protein